MSALNLPLVAPHVDLSNFEFMPLDVRRLRDSAVAAKSTGDEFRCAVLLWCAAWHQVPAGSLPDDDHELAQLAGYGRVIKEWKRVKTGALHGWLKCNDGRLYHPVVCEKALEAWDQKALNIWSRECDRIRKDNKRRKDNGLDDIGIPERPLANSGAYVHGNKQTSTGIPAENALKGTDLTGTDIKYSDTSVSAESENQSDPKDLVWSDGLGWLANGKSPDPIRPFLGKLCKSHGDEAVLGAICILRVRDPPPVDRKSSLVEQLNRRQNHATHRNRTQDRPGNYDPFRVTELDPGPDMGAA